MAEEEVKEVSRSQMIREYLKTASASESGPKAVVEAMKSKGINVSQQLVSQIKSALKTKTRKKAASAAAATKARSKSDVSVGSWLIAKNLLNSVGGDLAAAKKNLEIVSKLLH